MNNYVKAEIEIIELPVDIVRTSGDGPVIGPVGRGATFTDDNG